MLFTMNKYFLHDFDDTIRKYGLNKSFMRRSERRVCAINISLAKFL